MALPDLAEAPAPVGGFCLSSARDSLRPMPSYLDTVRDVIYRAAPISDDEREAFISYSAQLAKHLDAIEEAQRAAGQDTSHVTALRHLLDALPGVMV